jgi:hypothetical protein
MKTKLKFIWSLLALAYFLMLVLLTVYYYTRNIPPGEKFIYIFIVLGPTIISAITALIASQISDNRRLKYEENHTED